MGAITVARGASGSVCREYRDAGLHELGRLGGHCSTIRLGMRAITVARVPQEACHHCSTGASERVRLL